MKKCSSSLALKEMQIKITLSSETPPTTGVRMWGKRSHHTLLVGMPASTTTLGNNMDAFQKSKQICHMIQQSHS
jgi:hypothetical protein